MRFIGGKGRMLDSIRQVMAENITEPLDTVGDLFCGSGITAQFFKKQGFKVISNDIMYMSYVLARGMTELNDTPAFRLLNGIDVFAYLNQLSVPLDEENAFIYRHYCPNGSCERMYFQVENARKIDAVRQQIEQWYQSKQLEESEYYYLLASLLAAVPYVANIAGVYAAYLKHWDKRTYKTLQLQPIEIIHSHAVCEVYHTDAAALCKKRQFDFVYIDPPYNQREYVPNYHILETIAKYDSPYIKGVTGMRNYPKSAFCSRTSVKTAFEQLFTALKAKYALVSYNNEGLLSTEEMLAVLEQFGKVKLYEYPYRKYKSKIPNTKDGLKEQLYFVTLGG